MGVTNHLLTGMILQVCFTTLQIGSFPHEFQETNTWLVGVEPTHLENMRSRQIGSSLQDRGEN